MPLLLLLLQISLPAAPNAYICPRAEKPIRIDGRLDGQWRNAPWTSDFVDIEGSAKARPRFRTRAKMQWDDEYFYIAAELEESHVWGTLTQHDAVIFHDNDFELFVAPNSDSHEYFEFAKLHFVFDGSRNSRYRNRTCDAKKVMDDMEARSGLKLQVGAGSTFTHAPGDRCRLSISGSLYMSKIKVAGASPGAHCGREAQRFRRCLWQRQVVPYGRGIAAVAV